MSLKTVFFHHGLIGFLCLAFSTVVIAENKKTPLYPASSETIILNAENMRSLHMQASNKNSDARWYRIELLIFQQRKTMDEEYWRQNRQLTKQEKVLQLDTNDTTPLVTISPDLNLAWATLPAKLHELNSTEKRMRARNMPVLYHQAWIQPMQSTDKAIPILIHTRHNNDDLELSGTIKTSIQRYLHTNIDLLLTEYSDKQKALPWAENQEPSTAEQTKRETKTDISNLTSNTNPSLLLNEKQQKFIKHQHRLHANRRMKSKELHYIDHPKFGVLIKLWPLDEKQIEMLNEKLKSS